METNEVETRRRPEKSANAQKREQSAVSAKSAVAGKSSSTPQRASFADRSRDGKMEENSATKDHDTRLSLHVKICLFVYFLIYTK